MRLLHDQHYLSAMIGAIYDCALDPSRWTGVMAELAGLLGATRAFLGVGTPAGLAPVITAAPGYTIDDFKLNDLAINPIVPIGLTYPPDTSFVTSRDYGLDALRATRFYRAYLEPRDLLDAAAFLVTREGDEVGHWFVSTPPARGAITEEEAAGLTLVAPHIRRTVEISRVLGAARLEAETSQAALDALDSPVLLLGPGRSVVLANRAAERAIEGGQVLRAANGGVRGATEKIEALLTGLDAGGLGGMEAVVMGADGKERLVFALRPGEEAGGLPGAAPGTVLLVVRAPREDTRNPIAIAAMAFNLTSAQVQVLAFLAQGHGPEAIADILGISLTTVRSHLGELFQRTGTGRQAELVARTLALASPLATPPA